MAVGTSEVNELRKWLTQDGLDIDRNPSHRAQYNLVRRYFIGLNEESDCAGKPKVYEDPKGYSTVGIGFNMGLGEKAREGKLQSIWEKTFPDPKTRPDLEQAKQGILNMNKKELGRLFHNLKPLTEQEKSIRDEWCDAFPDPKTRPDFDKVRSGERKLSQEEIGQLFDHSADTRERELKSLFGKSWQKLKPNERLAVEDIYYNAGPRLVNKNCNFYKCLKRYADTGNQNDLDGALREIAFRSNREKDTPIGRGIQNRRDAEAEMLNTFDRNIDALRPAPVKTPTTQPKKPAEENPKTATKKSLRAQVDEAIEPSRHLLTPPNEAPHVATPNAYAAAKPVLPGSRDDHGMA